MMNPEQRLATLGIQLPSAPTPVAAYVPVVRTGNLIYISGQDARKDGQNIFSGKVGQDVSLEEAQLCARQAAINVLAVMKDYFGDLSRVKQIVKVLGFVNSADGFASQPFVINGGSELFEAVFGEKGKHARSAIGANELPFNTPVEIEVIVKID